MSEHNDKAFSYTYSSRQQAEIKAIRQKYLPQEEDKMTLLRRLDASASRRGSTAALSVGVLGTLVMGGGMSMCMVGPQRYLVPGIVLGLMGMAVAAMAYPLYVRITRRERERIAPQIIRLTDELLK